MRALTLALLLLAPVAYAETNRDQRAADTVSVEGGMHLGAIEGGDYAHATTGGLYATLGLQVSPDFVLEGRLQTAGDPFARGYGSTGWSFGVARYLTDTLRLGGGVRYRRFTDGSGIAEAIGRAFASGFCMDDSACLASIASDDIVTWDMGTEITLASRWHWDVFTLGVEWIALYQPLAVLGAERVFRNVEGERVGAKTFDPPVRDQPREWRALAFTMGVSF